jgi:hypothetical protein
MLKRDKVDLDLTSEDMNHLWGSVHATRDNTTTVKVDKATITRLLIDHQKLLVAYEKN